MKKKQTKIERLSKTTEDYIITWKANKDFKFKGTDIKKDKTYKSKVTHKELKMLLKDLTFVCMNRKPKYTIIDFRKAI